MVRRIVFEQVGQFSTDYFMYAEDMDLCYKITRAGWRNYFVGDATVIHHGGRSSSNRPNYFATIMMRESKLTFMRLRHGPVYALCHRCATAAISIARLLILAAVLPLAAILQRARRVQRSFGKWFKVLRWSVGCENWASTYVLPVSTAVASVPGQQPDTAAKVTEKI